MPLSRFCLIGVILLVASAARAQTTHNVQLDGFQFLPSDITIEVGDTVHWVWVSGLHNVVSGVVTGGVGVPDGNFSSGTETSLVGTTFDVTFDQAFLDAHPMPDDVYPYFCAVHASVGMVGSVTIAQPIPTVSEWGLAAFGLLLLIAGTVLGVRRSQTAAAVQRMS